MSDPPNALAVEPLSQISAAVPPGPAASSSAPNVITYSYASRMVYVAPGETYDHAIDIAKESFLELKDVERQRIRLEVYVVLKNRQVHRTAEIGRTAWPFVVPSLARFEIMEIRVAPPVALSSQASAVEPPPYAPERVDIRIRRQMSLRMGPYGSHITSLQSPSPPYPVTRIVNLESNSPPEALARCINLPAGDILRTR